jgi:alpha-ribazole phosphatase
MEVCLIRHIEPDFEKGICYGQLDVPLPSNYKDIHAKIVKGLVGNYDVIYSSPLKRCKLLAEQVSDTVIFDERLMELSFGDWEGTKWEDINHIELNDWMINYTEVAPPKGESLKDLIRRFSSFISEIKEKEYSKILIVTHAGIIRSAMNLFNGCPLNKIMMEKVDYGELISFTLIDG